MNDTKRLEKIGLKGAAKKINEMREKQRKLDIAYKHFRFLTEDKIDGFNEKLKKETLRENKHERNYKRLGFISLGDYDAIPPEPVLQSIEKAIDKDCFDSFEVCKVEWHKEIKDPIVFGRIEGIADRFFIAQWDDDIKVDDIFLGDTSKAKK